MHDIQKCACSSYVHLLTECTSGWCAAVWYVVMSVIIGLSIVGCEPSPPPPESSLIAPDPALLSPAQAAPPEAQETFRAAQALRTAGNLSQALQAFAEFAQRYPNTSLTDDALAMVGDLATTQKAYEKAEIYYRLLLRSFPDSEHSPAARFKLGLVLYRMQDYDDSAATFQRYIATTLTNAEHGVAYYYVGTVAMRKQQYVDALADFKHALELSKDPEIVSQSRANIVTIVREHLTTDELIRLSQQYARAYPGELTLERLAQKYQEAKKFGDEAAMLQRLLATFPDYPDAPTVQARLQYLAVLLATDWNKLGVLLPLSGEDETIGKHALRGMELALITLKKQEPELALSLEVRDTGANDEAAQEALRALVQETRVIGVIGPLANQTALDLAPLADELAVPLLSPYARYGDFPALSVYTFRYTLTDKVQARALAEHAVNGLKRQRFAIMHPAELYGETLKEQFVQQLLRLQAEVVAMIAYPPTTTDFSEHLQALAAVQFDTLFLPDYAPRLALLLGQLGQQDLSNLQLLGADGWNTPEFLQQVMPLIEGGVFTDSFSAAAANPMVKIFTEEFRARYQEEPTALAAQGYDMVLLCAAVLKTGVKTRLEFRDSLLQVRNFQGITGPATMDPDGDAETVPYLFTIRDGQVQQLPAEPSPSN